MKTNGDTIYQLLIYELNIERCLISFLYKFEKEKRIIELHHMQNNA